MSTLARFDPPRPGVSLLRFLALSLLLHALLLVWLGRSPLTSDRDEIPPLVVKLAPPPAAAGAPKPQAAPPPAVAAAAQPKEQIVAPSDQENELPPLGRAFLSDRDNRVERETVHKGNPEAGARSEPQRQAAVAPPPAPPPAQPAPPKAAPAKPAPEPKMSRAERSRPMARPEQAKPEPRRVPTDIPSSARNALARPARPAPPPRPARELPGIDELLAPPAEVLARARGPEGSARGAPDARTDPRRDLTSAPPPAPGLFAGMRGTFDDLPEVAAGNLTMLNTKADRFAPFVRRVGTRVFQNLLIYQRRDLGVPEILAASSIVTVRALLDQKGRLKDLELIDRSGSHAVDQTLVDALREAAFDQNPPREAANDKGEFEFVFQAQLSAGVEPGADGPRVRTIESRLRVGLL